MKTRALILLAGLAAAGCSTTLTIHSTPAGAKLYLDGVYRGETPVTMTLEDGMDNGYKHLRIEKDGYSVLEAAIGRKQDSARLICGYFCLVPLLWMYKWDEVYSFPLQTESAVPPLPPEGKGFTPGPVPKVQEAPPAQL